MNRHGFSGFLVHLRSAIALMNRKSSFSHPLGLCLLKQGADQNYRRSCSSQSFESSNCLSQSSSPFMKRHGLPIHRARGVLAMLTKGLSQPNCGIEPINFSKSVKGLIK